MSYNHELHKSSRILNGLRPMLIISKCFAVSSIGNVFVARHTSSLKYNLFSTDTACQLLAILFCELFIDGGLKILPRFKGLNWLGILIVICFIFFIVCVFTEKKLLDGINKVDEADTLIRHLLPVEETTLTWRVYKWLAFLLLFSLYLFVSFTCRMILKNCISTQNLFSTAYQQVPFLAMVTLFCNISTELEHRFLLFKQVFSKNKTRWSDAQFLEDCRIGHATLAHASEVLVECFGFRLSWQLLIIVLHTVSFFCFPCFYGAGCSLKFSIQGVIQQLVLILTICSCASKVHSSYEDVLDALNVIPLDKSPFKCKDQIELFSCQVVARPLQVTACGFYDIGMSTLLAIFSVILMYTVIIAQLRDKLQQFMQFP